MPSVSTARFIGRFETETWWIPGASDTHAWRVRDRVMRRVVAWGVAPSELHAKVAAELEAAQFASQRRRIVER